MATEPATCLDCGAPLKRRGARRCRLHANRALNAAKPGSFDSDSARAAVEARTAKRAAELEELRLLRLLVGRKKKL